MAINVTHFRLVFWSHVAGEYGDKYSPRGFSLFSFLVAYNKMRGLVVGFRYIAEKMADAHEYKF